MVWNTRQLFIFFFSLIYYIYMFFSSICSFLNFSWNIFFFSHKKHYYVGVLKVFQLLNPASKLLHSLAVDWSKRGYFKICFNQSELDEIHKTKQTLFRHCIFSITIKPFSLIFWHIDISILHLINTFKDSIKFWFRVANAPAGKYLPLHNSILKFRHQPTQVRSITRLLYKDIFANKHKNTLLNWLLICR